MDGTRHTSIALLLLGIALFARPLAARATDSSDITLPVFADSQTRLSQQIGAIRSPLAAASSATAPGGYASQQVVAAHSTIEVWADADRATFPSGASISLTFRLTNTLGRAYYIGYTARTCDWHPEVFYLGQNGLRSPKPVRKTEAGEHELGGFGGAMPAFCINMPLSAGSVQSFGPVVLNRLFDMNEHGVYVIRVSQTISLTGRWDDQLLVSSGPVKIVVR